MFIIQALYASRHKEPIYTIYAKIANKDETTYIFNTKIHNTGFITNNFDISITKEYLRRTENIQH